MGLRHAVRHLFDQVLVDATMGAFSAAVGLAAVALPRHPAHGRRERQAIVQGPGLTRALECLGIGVQALGTSFFGPKIF